MFVCKNVVYLCSSSRPKRCYYNTIVFSRLDTATAILFSINKIINFSSGVSVCRTVDIFLRNLYTSFLLVAVSGQIRRQGKKTI